MALVLFEKKKCVLKVEKTHCHTDGLSEFVRAPMIFNAFLKSWHANEFDAFPSPTLLLLRCIIWGQPRLMHCI